MDYREFIAYEGDHFTIEWFFDVDGESQSLDYFEGLSEKEQDKLFHLFQRMGDFGKISDTTKFRNENNGIYAFKPKPDRFLCFFQTGKKIVITNAFRKRQDKLPKTEKERALKCRNDYRMRVQSGEYYDNED